jgi:hypothetical protein
MIEALHRLLPASISIVPDIRTMTADTMLESIEKQGVCFEMVRLCAGDWEIECSDLLDDEVLALLHMEDAGHCGELFICTEACTRYDLAPFRCHSTELASFISDYQLECFFDGDVIVICEESRTVTVFHHAGGYVHVRL